MTWSIYVPGMSPFMCPRLGPPKYLFIGSIYDPKRDPFIDRVYVQKGVNLLVCFGIGKSTLGTLKEKHGFYPIYWCIHDLSYDLIYDIIYGSIYGPRDWG